MENVGIVREIGEGSYGKVYLARRLDGETVALKVEYVERSSVNKGEELYNELRFAGSVAGKHPDRFIRLLDHKLVERCEEKLKHINPHLDRGEKARLERLRGNKLCVYKLYTVVDTTLRDVRKSGGIGRWPAARRYSLLLQLVDVNRILSKTGWVHGDLHSGNIGLITNSAEVPAGRVTRVGAGAYSVQVPTSGVLVQVIDYGSLMHARTLRPEKSYKGKSQTELDHYREHRMTDPTILFKVMYDSGPFWTFVRRRKVRIDYDRSFKKVAATAEYRSLRRRLPAVVSDRIVFEMTHIMHPAAFGSTVLGGRLGSKAPAPRMMFPAEDIDFVVRHMYDNRRLVKYLKARMDAVLQSECSDNGPGCRRSS